VDFLRERLDPRIEFVVPESFDEQSLVESARSAVREEVRVILFGPHVSEALLNALGDHLAFMQVPWAGVDRLDFQLLRRFRPTLCNSHSNAPCVAEHALALLLAAARAIPQHDRDLRAGFWRRPLAGPNTFLPPSTLSGSTVLLLGFGAVGREIAARLAGWNVRLLAVKRSADSTSSEVAAEPSHGLAAVGGPECLPDFARQADFVIVSLPLTPSTKSLVGHRTLATMKEGSFLVNVGRAETLEEEALYEALASRRIAGAALDTWYRYPSAQEPHVLPSARFPFHELENLVLSPHRAGFSRGAHPHLDGAVENLNRYAASSALQGRVDLDAEY
jgi:phosphoglycerate dehydrogenase-like enzyme